MSFNTSLELLEELSYGELVDQLEEILSPLIGKWPTHGGYSPLQAAILGVAIKLDDSVNSLRILLERESVRERARVEAILDLLECSLDGDEELEADSEPSKYLWCPAE